MVKIQWKMKKIKKKLENRLKNEYYKVVAYETFVFNSINNKMNCIFSISTLEVSFNG